MVYRLRVLLLQQCRSGLPPKTDQCKGNPSGSPFHLQEIYGIPSFFQFLLEDHMGLSAEERERSPIHYGSRERKRAILQQHVEQAYKYAELAEFPFISQLLEDVIRKGF